MTANQKPINLFSLSALDVISALISHTPATLLLSTNRALTAPLQDRFEVTPGLTWTACDGSVSSESVEHLPTSNAPFSLVLIDTFTISRMDELLTNPNLAQVVILQAAWLGRRLLPEWRSRPQKTTLAAINQRLGNWHFDQRSIGNLRALLWGFLSGRMLALNRLDLMDRCAARMRQHLFPDARPAALAYLRVLRWVKEHPNL